MIIRNLRVCHLENPLGYHMDKPVFTWTAEDSTGKRQATARVRISLTEDFAQCVYDSGEQAGISSLGFAPDVALSPRTRYFWRVEVTADDGDRAESETAWFETGKQDEPWQADWIRAPFDGDVHPILSRNFTLRQKPLSARIYAVGLGLYELNLNGRKVGDEVLAPFCNDYTHWIQAETYDVTDQLSEGENHLDVWLGNGWYKGRFGFDGGPCNIFGDRMQLLLELRAQMPDGGEVVIASAPDWSCRTSPILESSIYDGEVYDARMESASAAVPAEIAEAPAAPVEDRRSAPLRKVTKMPAPTLLHTPAGEQVLDFGQVMTGWVEFDCDLPEGARVLLQYGELLQNDCFYRENLRSAKAEYTYISKGGPAHVRPRFTFYGFRYVKVTGIDPVNPEDFTAWVIHSDLTVTGRMETSNPKVNRLIQNAFWGQIGNFVDVPTDCPQRDERMGWTGDAHVFAPTASFNMYTPAFYDKFLYDMILEQRELGGSVPFVVPDMINQIAKVRGKSTAFPKDHGSCAWGDAATGIPWTLYQFYGDKDMLARHYENMKRWTDYIRSQDETLCGGRRLWQCGFHFADWLALDNPERGSSFGGTDPYYIASAYYYFSARATARAAEALGNEQDRAEYDALADEVREAFRQEFFTPTGRIAEPTQTAMIMALHLNLVPEESRERLKKDLRQKIASRKDHLDTGFVGTYYICRTLTDNGMSDVAYTLLLNEDFPSWLYEVNMGATTVWERWNSVLPDGSVSDTGMNSMNHYAYGSVVEWMYRYMAGLNPAEPGFKRARIAPVTDPRFTFVKAEYDSAAGLYKSAWTRDANQLTCEIEVPFDCTADFVPQFQGEWIVDGAPIKAHGQTFPLAPGKHTLTYAG